MKDAAKEWNTDYFIDFSQEKYAPYNWNSVKA